MLAILDGLIPVFLVIALGFVMRVSGFVTQEHWNGLERVAYFILIPALMITTLATADLSRVPVLPVGLSLVLPIIAIGALLFAARAPMKSRLDVDGPAFTSVLQGAIRWNAFVGISLTGTLYGKEGVALTAVAFAAVVPLVNVMSAYALARHGAEAKPFSAASLAIGLIRNPFIWSTAVGIVIGILAPPIPKAIASFGDILGRAVLAAGLLLAGSGLHLGHLRRPGFGFWLANVIKLIAMPLATGLIGQALGLSGVNLAVPVMCAAAPTAATAYIQARQSGGDAPLMASILTAQTLAAAVTIPLMLLLFAS
jgi:malonate transporter and related proteins